MEQDVKSVVKLNEGIYILCCKETTKQLTFYKFRSYNKKNSKFKKNWGTERKSFWVCLKNLRYSKLPRKCMKNKPFLKDAPVLGRGALLIECSLVNYFLLFKMRKKSIFKFTKSKVLLKKYITLKYVNILFLQKTKLHFFSKA